MNVVGHDDEFVDRHVQIRTQLRALEPFVAGYFAERVQTHVVIDDLAEQMRGIFIAPLWGAR